MTMNVIPDVADMPLMTFGTDDAVAHVIASMIEHENVDAGAVLYGCTNVTDAVTAWHALHEYTGGDVAREVARRAFRWAGSYFLDAEWSAVLFESLTDYAVAETVCDADADTHTGYAGEVCDCERRGHAWSWAAAIAEIAAGVELV